MLTKQQRIVRAKNDKVVLVPLPMSWSRDDVECLTQYMFEVMNVPGLLVVEQPLATLYGYGVQSGLVLDLGYETCGKFLNTKHQKDVAAVFENQVVRYGVASVSVGGKDVMKYLATLLQKDQEFKKHYKGPVDEAFLKALLESETCAAMIPGITDQDLVPVAHFEYQGQRVCP